MSSFKIGDVVRLKSGSPSLHVTVVAQYLVGDAEAVQCDWFSGEQRNSGVFVVEALELVAETAEFRRGTKKLRG